MRRIGFLVCIFVLLAGWVLSGCSKQADPPQRAEKRRSEIEVPATPALEPINGSPVPTSEGTPTPTPEIPTLTTITALTPLEKSDTALLTALGHMRDRKYADALAKLEEARTYQDSEQVWAEIEKVKRLIDQENAAIQTVANIETVLKDGKSEDAGRLASSGLQQFGDTDAAVQLAKLKRQADALTAGQLSDNAARSSRFRAEAETALREKNLRAAAIAYESALQYGEDASLRRQLDELSENLKRYDDRRQQHSGIAIWVF